jgi:curved DNA-binding protein CbpA
LIERDAYEVLQVHPKAHDTVIQAAYRVLARLYHPDRDPSPAATRKMAELNRAYARVRTGDLRVAYERERRSLHGVESAVVTPFHPEAERPGPRRDDTLDFGRYAGWTIRDLARRDPDYLRWLSRHSSGIRFRQQIEDALRQYATGSASERLRPDRGARG